MIEALFKFANNHILITIKNKKVFFANTASGNKQSEIDNLKLDQVGVVREFPDLAGKADWKQEAIKRFKEKINLMENEDEILTYIVEELKKFGYEPMYKQKPGFRPQLLN